MHKELKYPDNSFDFVFCKGVLHHTGNTYKGLSELKRVLKKDSNAFIYLYGSDGVFWRTRKLMRKVMKKIPKIWQKLVKRSLSKINSH